MMVMSEYIKNKIYINCLNFKIIVVVAMDIL